MGAAVVAALVVGACSSTSHSSATGSATGSPSGSPTGSAPKGGTTTAAPKSSRPAVPHAVPGHPSAITVDGQREVLDVHASFFESAVVDARDRRLVDVVYDVPAASTSTQSPICTPPTHPFAFVERQDRSSVVVDVAGYTPALPKGGSGVAACDEEIASYRLLPARLDRPLGHRALYNNGDDTPVRVTDGRTIPTPRHIPRGYVAAGYAASFDEQIERQYRHGPYELDITVGPPLTGHLDRSGRVTSVGSSRAYLDHVQDFHSVSWARAGVDYEVSDQRAQSLDPQGGNAVYTPSDVSPSELLRVARSLRYQD